MNTSLGPILISRKARHPGDNWKVARSWFGGSPRLGGQPWPRSPSGKPLVFMAQICLAELAGVEPSLPFRASGSLAFFLGMGSTAYEAAVLHIPAGTEGAPAEPIPKGVTAFNLHGDLFPENPSPWARSAFSYWPVDLTILNIGEAKPPDENKEYDDDEYTIIADSFCTAMSDAVSANFARRQYLFSSAQAYKTLSDGSKPFWWHGAQSYGEQLKNAHYWAAKTVQARLSALEEARAKVARQTPKGIFKSFGRKAVTSDKSFQNISDSLAKHEALEVDFQRQMSNFPGFIAELEALSADRDPWALMDTNACESLGALIARAGTEFKDILHFAAACAMDDLATETLIAMAVGDDRAFASMPEPIRDLINNYYRLPTGAWHQMFGYGMTIQDNAHLDNLDNHMLLQIVHDDMMGWNFGDMGCFQFWISPADLAAQNWAGVEVTFECS